MDELLKNEIEDFLLSQPKSHKSANGKQLTFRCPWCGDSQHSQSETNFWVKINPRANEPMMYQCFRSVCRKTGVVDQELLTKLGYGKYSVIRELNKYNRKNCKIQKRGLNLYYKKQIANVAPIDNSVNRAKLKYVNSRLGTNLSYTDIFNLKLNFNMDRLLRNNNVTIPDTKKYYYKKLTDYGIGFISAYNDYVTIRDVSKKGVLRRRYTNINIFDQYDNATKFYIKPGTIDVMSSEPVVLNVTEGAFDILGVYYNTNLSDRKKYKNHLFAAASGAGIDNLIFHYIQMYGLIDIRVNVFSDADVDIRTYNSLYRLKDYVKSFNINIYYNTLAKDFGVTKDEISIIKSKL